MAFVTDFCIGGVWQPFVAVDNERFIPAKSAAAPELRFPDHHVVYRRVGTDAGQNRTLYELVSELPA